MADLKKTFSKGLTTLNVKTSNFMEQNKIKTYISTLESEISNLKFQIGDLMYSSMLTGTDNQEQVKALLDEIKQKADIIDEQQKMIADIIEKEKQILGAGDESSASGKVFCTQCGSENKMGYKFCEKCGNAL